MESVMLRKAIPLRASSSRAFVGLPLLHPCSRGNGARLSSTSIQTSTRCSLTVQTATQAALAPLSLPKEYGYVILTAAGSAMMVQWQAIKMYEDAEESVFNCYQRAHQNTLESYPSVLALLAIGGLGYPITTSVLGIIWIIGRVVYSLGYYTGDPSKRFPGMFHFFAFVGLIITCLVLGVRQTGLLPA